ncbi:MAG: dienelactone hydrolase family protein [Cyanobacteria bacterium]|nr:dienelactone hydrolase family protein [Cyanobacteriota bacterium]MDA1245738.1 dienelactone hydrolase family protein [Cyanobacteriota bacterium]
MNEETSQPGNQLIRSGPDRCDRRLVLLHGWGADADDLLDLAALLVGTEVSVVALRAPLAHTSGSGRQWYDLQQPNWPQLPAARTQLRERLLALAVEVPLQKTALLGFSQGAAMALDVATAGSALPLAGLIGCSGYPHPGWQPAAASLTKILLTHGEQDPVVPYEASEAIREQLQLSGIDTELVGFSGGHTIDSCLFPALRSYLAGQWSC